MRPSQGPLAGEAALRGIDPRARVHEHICNGCVASLHSHVQQQGVPADAQVCVSPVLEQQPDDIHVTRGHCQMEGCLPDLQMVQDTRSARQDTGR
jgi:hypothetical protein